MASSTFKLLAGFFFFFLFLAILPSSSTGESYTCNDLEVLFARGSGQLHPDNPQYENDGGQKFFIFEASIEESLPESINYSIEDIPYPATSVDGLFGDYNTRFNAKFWWYPWGAYRDSVTNGVNYAVNRIEVADATCGDQTKIALAGYSQGAQVMGDALKQLDPNLRRNIINVSLFGDPKRHGEDGVAQFYGSATKRSNGILDPRKPYMPTDMQNRVHSWCDGHDGICNGNELFAAGPQSNHGGYANRAVPHAASKLVNRFFALREIESGQHVISEEVVNEQVGLQIVEEQSQSRSLIVVVDRSNSMRDTFASYKDPDVQSQIRAHLLQYFDGYQFGLVSYANKDFDQQPRVELEYGGSFEDLIQALANVEIESLPTEAERGDAAGNNIVEHGLEALAVAGNMLDNSSQKKEILLIGDTQIHSHEDIDGQVVARETVYSGMLDKNIVVHAASESRNHGYQIFGSTTGRFGGKGNIQFNPSGTFKTLGTFNEDSHSSAFTDTVLYVEPNQPVEFAPTTVRGQACLRRGLLCTEGQIDRYGKFLLPIRKHVWSIFDRRDSFSKTDSRTTTGYGPGAPLSYSFPEGFDGFVVVRVEGSNYHWGHDTIRVIARDITPKQTPTPPSFDLEQTGVNQLTLNLDLENQPPGAWKLYNTNMDLLGIVSSEQPRVNVHGVPTGENVQVYIGEPSEGATQQSASIVLDESFSQDPTPPEDEEQSTNNSNDEENSASSINESSSTSSNSTPQQDARNTQETASAEILQGSSFSNSFSPAVVEDVQPQQQSTSDNNAQQVLGNTVAKTLQTTAQTHTDPCALGGCNNSFAKIFTITVVTASGVVFTGYLMFRPR